ncbi:MAG TPA: hypothetical protein VGF44_09660 [Terriglobales bacterium]
MRNRFQRIFLVLALVVSGHSLVHAQATLLLEEPYSYDGNFAGTGHAAVYLSRVCEASPIRLRRCAPGETGVVIARYHGIAGYDWIAIPLIPYLYAVEKPGDIPLYADPKLVDFLRYQYLPHLKALLNNVPTSKNGTSKNDTSDSAASGNTEPRGPWYELNGSAYDRTLYGFQIPTRPEQDDALIHLLNSSPNHGLYNLLHSNCADFSKQIINFYYPHATHRSIIADLGVTTPKQVAKTLVHYSKHHPGIEMTPFIIPQVPGTKRSKPIHGVLETALFEKKYMALFFFLHPFAIGGLETAYITNWHFDPGRNALMFDISRGLEAPISPEARHVYQERLDALRLKYLDVSEDSFRKWPAVDAQAIPQMDETGHAILEMEKDGRTVQIGLCRNNALHSTSPQLSQQLLIYRLDEELKSGRPARASLQQVENDFRILEKTTEKIPTEFAGDIQWSRSCLRFHNSVCATTNRKPRLSLTP